MESSDAAMALALQLGLINAQTEKTGLYDEDITLAAVQALGAIGDKAAFDYLLYISYLPYPEHIQAAAKEALNRLKW
jgi:HEAT repeat protein